MQIVGIVLTLAIAIAPGVAAAQQIIHTFTTAADSSAVDFGGCAEVTVRCDQSVTDASADAVVDLLACQASDTPFSSCTPLRTCPSSLPDGADVSIGGVPASHPYLMAHVVTGASGGDTGRLIASCAKLEDAPQSGCRVVPFSAAGDYGPYDVGGHVMRFDLDGDATSAETTGATATVEGCTDFSASQSTCSCDLVDGSDVCATYNGATGAAGFVAIAPRTVTVTIESVVTAGTFTVCSW